MDSNYCSFTLEPVDIYVPEGIVQIYCTINININFSTVLEVSHEVTYMCFGKNNIVPTITGGNGPYSYLV